MSVRHERVSPVAPTDARHDRGHTPDEAVGSGEAIAQERGAEKANERVHVDLQHHLVIAAKVITGG